MPEQRTSLIIFTDRLKTLGEVALERGAFKSVTLNRDGERLLGAAFEEWQTQGVLAFEPRMRQGADEVSMVVSAGRVQLRSPQFAVAFAQWLEDHGCLALDLPEDATPAWNALSQLPLHPRERVLRAVAFRDRPPRELASWIGATERLLRETQKA